GTSEELKAQMGATVLELSFADPAAARAAVGDVASVVPGAEADGLLVRVTVPDGTHSALEVLRTLDARQIEVAGMTLREPSLDDVFLSLTGRPTDAEAADGDGSADPPQTV